MNGTFDTRNLAARLAESLPAAVYEKLLLLQQLADRQGIGAYLVGGLVRDLLLGHPTNDLDVVLETDAPGFALALEAQYRARLYVHEAFRTVAVTFADGCVLDLVTARCESYPEQGDLPVVCPATLHEDLARRDLSINTLALYLTAPRFGEIIDEHGGLTDLAMRQIRVLHPGSFRDDPTRLFRAIRYAERYRFILEPQTARYFEEAVATRALDYVTGARIRHEFERLFSEEFPSRSIAALDQRGMLASLDPDWSVGEQQVRRLERLGQVGDQCQLLGIDADTERLGWLAMLVGSAEGVRERLTQRLVLDGDTQRAIRNADSLLASASGWSEDPCPSEVYAACCGIPAMVTAFVCWGIWEGHPSLERYLQSHREVRPWINGEHLKAVGLEPGPHYTAILREFLAMQLDGDLDSPEHAGRILKERYGCQKPHSPSSSTPSASSSC